MGIPLIYLGFYEQSLFNAQLVVIATASFFLGTFFLSPDLDLAHSTPTKNWGPLRFLWKGYHLLFKHRGRSHSLLFSSLTKIIYLGCVLYSLLFLGIFLTYFLESACFSQAFAASQESFLILASRSWDHLSYYRDEFTAVIVGISISDWIHILTDRIYSAAKKLVS